MGESRWEREEKVEGRKKGGERREKEKGVREGEERLFQSGDTAHICFIFIMMNRVLKET